MKFYNSWNYLNSMDSDKLKIEFRVSRLTLFYLYIDLSDKYINIKILNFGIKNK